VSVGALLLVVFGSVVLIGVAIVLWRIWDGLTHTTPEEEAYERRVAQLNERQANRLSDDDLRRSSSLNEAWQITVDRGRRSGKRRQRYNGDLNRRRPKP
jgi:hypothetical protein